MKASQDSGKADSQPSVDLAEGYISLGLLDMAEAEIQRAVEVNGETPAVLDMKCRVACARRDYSTVGSLTEASIETSRDPADVLHTISISGDPEWVYARCLSFEEVCRTDDLYWFNRACFACRVGNMRDALASLCRGFELSNAQHARAFVDPDLESLWSWMLDTPLNDETAELLADHIWQKAIRTQEETSEELELSPRMEAAIPEKFRAFLVPTVTMLQASPKMPPALYKEYLEWQKTVALLRVDALSDAHARARTYLVDRQPRFALHQIKRGNLTAARFHILHYLAFRPHELPQLMFMRNLGMGYLLDDISPAIEEDTSFVHKMEAVVRHSHSPHRPLQDTFEAVGTVGKKTALYQARLASHEIDTGQVDEGIRRLLGVMKLWPEDALSYSRLVDAYIRLEQWEKARLCFRAAPAHYKAFYQYRVQWHRLKEESYVVVVPLPPTRQFVGQRDLGALIRDPDESTRRQED